VSVVIGIQELCRFAWYKESMTREEAEKKVRDYKEVLAVQFIAEYAYQYIID